AEVLDRRVRRVADPVDLLPRVPADVTHTDLVRARPEREPERVAEAVGDVPVVGRDAVADEGVVGHRVAGIRIDPGERAAALGRVAARAQVLRPERSTLRRRQAQRRAGGRGRVAASVGGDDRVGGAAVLAPVGEARRRALAGGDVQRAVRAERDVVDRVGLLLVAPVRAADQDLLGAVRLVRVLVDGDAGQAAGGGAAILRAARRQWTGVVVERNDAAARLGVDHVGRVDVRTGRELGVDREAEQAPVTDRV